MKNLPVQKLRKAIWREHFWVILSCFHTILNQIEIDYMQVLIYSLYIISFKFGVKQHKFIILYQKY